MSYLVEQPPHCDLLRLSLSTGRFVRYRRTRLPQRVDTASSLRFFSFHACLSRPLRVRGRTRGAFFRQSPSIPGPRPHVVGGSSYRSLKSGEFFLSKSHVSRTSASRARVNGGSNYHSLKSDKSFLKLFQSPTFPGPRPHGNTTRWSSYHSLNLKLFLSPMFPGPRPHG